MKGNHRAVLGPDAVVIASDHFELVIAWAKISKVSFAAGRGLNPMIVQSHQTILESNFFRSDECIRRVTKLDYPSAAGRQFPGSGFRITGHGSASRLAPALRRRIVEQDLAVCANLFDDR